MKQRSPIRASDYWLPNPRSRRDSLPGVTRPTRYCSGCKQPRPLAGGNGSRKPWRCASCKPAIVA